MNLIYLSWSFPAFYFWYIRAFRLFSVSLFCQAPMDPTVLGQLVLLRRLLIQMLLLNSLRTWFGRYIHPSKHQKPKMAICTDLVSPWIFSLHYRLLCFRLNQPCQDHSVLNDRLVCVKWCPCITKSADICCQVPALRLTWPSEQTRQFLLLSFWANG